MKKIILLLIFAQNLISQTPDWSMSLGIMGLNEVLFIKESSKGIVVVGTKNKIIGISSKNRKIVWESNDFGSINDESFDLIDGTSYATFVKNSTLSSKDFILFNIESGKVVYTNEETNESVINTTLQLKKEKLILMVKENGGIKISYRSLLDGSEIWQKQFIEENQKSSFLSNLLNIDAIFFNAEPNNDIGERLIFKSKNKIICLNQNDGSEVWQKKYDDRIFSFMRSDDDKYLMTIVKGKLNYIDIESGKEMLKEPLKYNEILNGVQVSQKGYILKTNGGFNILQKDGTLLFKKNYSKWTPVNQLFELNDGYLITSACNERGKKIKKEADRQIEMMRPTSTGTSNKNDQTMTASKRFFLKRLDLEGNTVWDTWDATDDVDVQFLPNSIFVRINEAYNVLDAKSGKYIYSIFSNAEKKSSVAINYDEFKIVQFKNGTINEFDLMTNTYKTVVKDFKFLDVLSDDEQITIEATSDGYFLATNQNYAFLNKDGSVKYNKNLVDVSGVSKKLRKDIDQINGYLKIAGFLTQASAFLGEFSNGNETNMKKFNDRMRAGDFLIKAGTFGDNLLSNINNLSNTESSISNETITILTIEGKSPTAVVINKKTGAEVKKYECSM